MAFPAEHISKMKLDFTTLDVFTKQRLSGNQVAIIRIPAVLRDQINEEQKQKIAAEFNLSETVFLNEAGKDDEVVDYDIFTPLSRIAFAGRKLKLPASTSPRTNP